jgi:ribose transport system permease protein
VKGGAPAVRIPEWRSALGRVEPRDYGIVVSFLALFVTLSLLTDTFLQKRNLLNILDQSAPAGIIACAIAICIIAGIFDLSTGAMFAVSAVVAATAANSVGPWLGIASGCLAGLCLGTVNGAIVHFTRVHSFIGTLATSIVYRGLAIIVTGGLIVSVTDERFGIVGRERFLDARYAVYIFVAVILLTSFLLHRTTFGRYVYAVGGNPEAARLSGIRVGLVRGGCFALSGLCSGIAGVLAASRVSAAQADMGIGLELTAIAAAVLGGVSIMGGEGAVWRAVLGILILTMIGNGFNLLGIDTTYQLVVQGTLILAAVAADQLLRRRPG